MIIKKNTKEEKERNSLRDGTKKKIQDKLMISKRLQTT